MAKHPKLKTISDGGLILHYKDYYKRSLKPVPMCRTTQWDLPDKLWREDDGVGTSHICARCVKIEESRRNHRKRVAAAGRKRSYWANHEKELAKAREYHWECRDVIILKKRLRDQRKREARLMNTSQA